MAVTAKHIRELMALGILGEVLVRVIEIIDDASLLASRDGRDAKAKAADRARAYRDRKRDARHVTRNGDGVTPPPPSSFSPIPPHITTSPLTSLRSENPERARVVATWPADAFDRFWAVYPLKVGRKAAFRALNAIRLRGEVEFPKLLAGVVRYASAVDPNYTAHPTTWLNRGQWDDEVRTKSENRNGKITDNPRAGSVVGAIDRRLAEIARESDPEVPANDLFRLPRGPV